MNITLRKKDAMVMNKDEIYIQLEEAVKKNRLGEVAEMLLAYPDIDLNDDRLFRIAPPLYIAAQKGFLEMCQLLVEKGAYVNFTKDRLFFPLWGAASGNHLPTAKFLCENGGDINAYETAIESALNIAASKGNMDIIRYFLDRGADINRLNINRLLSPLDWSIIYGHDETSLYLRKNGALSNIQRDYEWNEGGGGISQYIDNNIGRVIPNKFNETENGVFNRLAVVNGGKNSLLFSVGNYKYSDPYAEFILVLPFGWNPYSTKIATEFPYMIMRELTNQIRKGRRYVDGDLVLKTDDGFCSLRWPDNIAGFYIVDYNYSNVSNRCSFIEDTIEDTVTLFNLVPVKATKKGYTAQSLEKLKAKKWKGLELNI